MRYGRAAAAIACVSTRVNRRTQALDRPGHAPLVTIPCGIPMRPPQNRLVHSSEPLRLAWVGRMDEAEKRVSDLPKIAAQLRDTGVIFTFDLMGDGPARESLAQAFDSLDLGARIRMHPWSATNDVLDLLARSDVLLMSSNSEGMSITVMEALSAGCSIVSSRVSGVEDYESHAAAESCLWIYDIGDVAGAVERVRAASRIPLGVRAAARATSPSRSSPSACAPSDTPSCRHDSAQRSRLGAWHSTHRAPSPRSPPCLSLRNGWRGCTSRNAGGTRRCRDPRLRHRRWPNPCAESLAWSGAMVARKRKPFR